MIVAGVRQATEAGAVFLCRGLQLLQVGDHELDLGGLLDLQQAYDTAQFARQARDRLRGRQCGPGVADAAEFPGVPIGERDADLLCQPHRVIETTARPAGRRRRDLAHAHGRCGCCGLFWWCALVAEDCVVVGLGVVVALLPQHVRVRVHRRRQRGGRGVQGSRGHVIDLRGHLDRCRRYVSTR